MKNQNNSIRASALQVTLSLALLLGLATLFASSFNAATPNNKPVVVAQGGFYPPLPALAPMGGPTPTCTPIEVDDKITLDDPKQLGRINPGNVPSTCGAPNGCNTSPGDFHFKAHTFVNDTGEERCVTTTLATGCAGQNAIFATAYLGSFDPANICTNVIGDAGVISTGVPATFSYNVPAGATFIVVVAEVNENATCSGYKLDLFGLCPPTSTPTPTPTPKPSPTPTPTPGDNTSQLTHTGVTCSEFNSGTAPSLTGLEYSLKGSPAYVNQVNPGAFFYWVKVPAQAGNNIITVNESITSGNFNTLFAILAGSNVFNSDCVSQHPTITQSGGTITLQFNAPSAGTYIALVKFHSQSIKFAPAPSPGTTVHYTFSTNGVPASTEEIDLVKKVND